MTIPTRSDFAAAFYAALATADPTDPAAVIRAAVDVVLPEERAPLPRDYTNDFRDGITQTYYKHVQRHQTKAQFLALADAIQQQQEEGHQAVESSTTKGFLIIPRFPGIPEVRIAGLSTVSLVSDEVFDELLQLIDEQEERRADADPTPNDCLSCRFALWRRTGTGRLHPSGDGRCTWKGWRDWKIPGSMYYVGKRDMRSVPGPDGGGLITRREPITSCPCWEAIQDG